MSDWNSRNNVGVWFDVPVADLDRAIAFYRAVLGIKVERSEFPGGAFAVFAHQDGNGGCLVPKAEEAGSKSGILVYFNVDGRIRAAVEQVTAHAGRIAESVHAIGPHGFRAIVLDSEGNRIALHSTVDA
jgi:predicted enzyme related to lactoylglutathione lyase